MDQSDALSPSPPAASEFASLSAPDASESIQAALRAWTGALNLPNTAKHQLSLTEINLAVLQKQLDSQGLDIVENQKESNKNKKKLADMTKEFKKIPDEEKLKEFKVLLKAYQQEIDVIGKRSKVAESYFLSLYKHLAEAPDPAPLISSLSNHPQLESELALTTEENTSLKATIAQMERDVASGKASEGAVGGLKSRLATYEAKLDEMVAEKVLAKEIEIKQATDEKIRIYKETEYALQRQLNLMKDQLSSLQSSHDVSQAKLVDYSSQYDQEVAGKLGELEIVIGDLDRANSKAATVSRENEILKNELAMLRGDASAISASMQSQQSHRHDWQDPVTLQHKLKAQDAEISKLLEELNKFKGRLSEREAFSSRRINELERELAVKKLETEQLREKLLRFDDYERIKRELDLLKNIEFGSHPTTASSQNDGLWDEPSTPAGGEPSLEKLLMDKNKRLQAEVDALKDTVDSQTADLNHTREDLQHFQLQCENQKSLLQRLEEDVYNLNSIVASKTGGSAASSSVGTAAKANAENEADMDPLMAINVRSQLNNQPDLVPVLGNSVLLVGVPAAIETGSPIPSTGGANSSIIPILASQRDRYRQRNAELEEQAKSNSNMIADLKHNMDSLKSDNIKLYEKLRYAESFSNSSTASTNRHQQAAAVINIPSTPNRSGDDISNRYNTLYETNLDPFQRFSRNERTSRVNKLNAAEKAALMFTRVLVGNKYTRIGFVVYSVVLHCLVFATLYLLSQWEECRHDHVVPMPGSAGAGSNVH
ncbi:hypothetical protein HDU98_003573 [Podochytrium sp. JEL0797]|nr:hypothetical protein HDU98_003573 [Podochytrium sp. JEL0797]